MSQPTADGTAPHHSPSLLPAQIAELRTAVSGTVVTRDDPSFAATVACANTLLVQSPDAAVIAADVDDVAATVRLAQSFGVPLRVQSTGHGTYSAMSHGILLILSTLDSVVVVPDADGGVATLGAGVRWGVVVASAAQHGLAPVTGSSPMVGSTGLIVGGGIGPLCRSHGYASDYLVSATVVTGRGNILTVGGEGDSASADLLSALRGGKYPGAIVTELTVRLVPLPELYAGGLFFDTPDVEVALRGWLRWTEDAPDDVSTSLALLRFPDLDVIPEVFRGRFVAHLRFAFPGAAAEGERLAEPLRALAPVYLDALGPMAAADVAAIHNDPTDPGPGWAKGAFFSAVDDGFADVLWSSFGSDTPPPFLGAELRHLGGATAGAGAGRYSARASGSAVRAFESSESPAGNSAANPDLNSTADPAVRPAFDSVGGRDASYCLTLISAPVPELIETVVPGAAAALFAALTPWRAPHTNINFAGAIGTPEEYAASWPEDTQRRLIEVRDVYDPERLLSPAYAG